MSDFWLHKTMSFYYNMKLIYLYHLLSDIFYTYYIIEYYDISVIRASFCCIIIINISIIVQQKHRTITQNENMDKLFLFFEIVEYCFVFHHIIFF